MLLRLNKLLTTGNNSIETAKLFLDTLKINVTHTTLTEQLEHHPDYPTLLSISDALTSYGIDNMALKIETGKLKDLPSPFIVLVKGENNPGDHFSVVRSVNNSGLVWFDQEHNKWEEISNEDFIKRWPSKIVLIADPDNAKGENKYAQTLREERRVQSTKVMAFFSIPALALIEIIASILNYRTIAIFPSLFALFMLAGTVVGGLLLWYELDQYNPFLRQICSGGKKTNCRVILNSKASKIAGVRWSVIGFTYFTGGLLNLLFGGILNPHILFMLSWLSVIASLFILYSVYYQWQVAKEWCVLCLCVQGLLAAQVIVTLWAKWQQASTFDARVSGQFFISYALPFIAVSLLMPAYRSTKQGKQDSGELQRLKHNPQIFEALLAKQKVVSENPKDLGITLGNPNGKYKIIKVCNPYCGPCSQAHKSLEDLLDNNPEVQMHILFTATLEGNDNSVLPVRHMLAIADKKDEGSTKRSLDDWYFAEKKYYPSFAAKHPMNGELILQDKKIKAMSEWCTKTGITFTPTFFISIPSLNQEDSQEIFHQLPEMYNITDLKYFLTI